jgi:hypothetical protein
MLTVIVLPILCLILELNARCGSLSYDLVMASLKMADKRRNMLAQPNWRI